MSTACSVTSRESASCAIRITSVELDARKRNGPHADLFLDRRSDSEESASSRSDGGPINVETALTEIVVGWLEAARLGSSRSVSCGSKANILASATGGNRAPWIILRTSCTKGVVQLNFLAFLSSWASWYPRARRLAWWITTHERWAPAIRNQVFLRFKGSPRTLFRGVLHTLQECASVTSKPATARPGPTLRVRDRCFFERKALN